MNMDDNNQKNTEANCQNISNFTPKILIKNQSIQNLVSNLKLKKLNMNYELPFIHSKIKVKDSTKSEKNILKKKLSFNFISFDYQNKLRLLSQITPLNKKINKYYSIKEINDFNKKNPFPMNYHKTMDDNISITRSRNNKKSNFISRNVSDIYDKSSLGIVNLSSNFSVKEDTKNNNNTKSENKEKMNLSKYQRFIDLKKDLNEILNPKYIKEKKYQLKKHYVHNCLFKSSSPLFQEKINKGYNNPNDKFPKFEYINYFGITHKLITGLTSNNKNNSEENELNNNKNKYLKLQLKLKSPDSFDYENIDDFRNKKYIEQIQKEIKIKKQIDKEIIEEKNERIKNFNEKARKGYRNILENNQKYFAKFINDVINKKNMIDNKLEHLIEIDKKINDNDFDNIKSNRKSLQITDIKKN